MKTMLLNLSSVASSTRTMRFNRWFILCLGCFVCLMGGGQSAEMSLHLAIRSGDSSVWKKLLEEGADINAKDSKGNSALHLAALHGQVDCVESLLKRGADANVLNDAEATPLLYGITRIEIVEALLEHHADPNAKSKTGMTPLLAAATRGQSFPIIKMLVDAGADIHVNREGPWDGGALFRAIQAGDPRTIDFLLNEGIRIEAYGKSFSPLHTAAMGGDLRTVKRLVEMGADLNYSENGWGDSPGHALNWAMWAEHHEIATYLIDQGIDLHFAPSIGNETPPMVWAGFGQKGDASIARMLIERGLNVLTTNAAGETALSYALKSGFDTELVEFLKQHGASQVEPSKTEKKIPMRHVPQEGGERDLMIRDRAQRSINLMQSSSDQFLQNRDDCLSCHHQFLPAFAYGMAQERGLHFDELSLGNQLKRQTEPGEDNNQDAVVELVFGGFSGGLGLAALHALGFDANERILNDVRYIRETQSFKGTWTTFGRPPMDEPSPFQMTAWAVYALRLFPRQGEADVTANSIKRAMAWLRQEKPANLNQRIMQLLGLYWGGDVPGSLRKYIQPIIKQQRPDGGWSQLETLESDAWATGQTLYALYVTGGLSPNDPVFAHGIDYLLRTQFEDGSWWVKSRAWPFQPHFDSGFPHGKDQWISIGATAWATMALLTTIEPVKPTADFPTGQELIGLWEKKQKENLRDSKPNGKIFKEQTVDFQTEIQPMLERSCISCHSGKRAKGDFVMNSRQNLLKGGQSEMPSIVPGDAGHSPLIRFVTDQVEDLEMPPLGKRNKYPALTAEEINKLTLWINEGAF